MEETKNKEYVGFKVIRDAFRFLEIPISETELQFLLLNLFSYTFDLENLPYKKIFSQTSRNPPSPGLKSPTKRLNSIINPHKTSFSSQSNRGFSRVSISMNYAKRPSNFSSMSEQIEQVLNKNNELLLEKKNEEINSN